MSSSIYSIVVVIAVVGIVTQYLATNNQTPATVLKIHGSVISIATQRALACLYEKDIEFEFVAVDMASGDHKKEPFLSMNPFGLVPVLEDGNLTLFESRAITKHLARVYHKKGTKLIFAGDDKKASTLAVWMEVEAHQFDPHGSKLAFEHYYKPMLGMGSPSEEVVEEEEEKLSKILEIYETRLLRNKYLSGDEFGLADLHHLPVVQILMNSPEKKLFEANPHVHKWVVEILARPSWVKVLEMQGK